MLFKNISELSTINNAVNEQLNFIELKPSIELAESQLMREYIGNELYAEINNAYNAVNPSLTAPQIALLPYLRRPIAAMALLHFIPKSEATITSTGIMRFETSESKTAFQQQVIKLRMQLQFEAENAIEDLMQYLDANHQNFSSWTGSHQFRQYRSLFIQSGRQLADVYYCASPYRIYHKLRQLIFDAEQQQLKKILGDVFFAELKAKMALTAPALSDAEKELLLQIRKYLAYTTISRAAASQLITWDDRGITVYDGQGRSENSDDSKRTSITPQHIDHFIKQHQQYAQDWLQSLSFFISSTASNLVFASWYTWQQTIAASSVPHCSHTSSSSFSL